MSGSSSLFSLDIIARTNAAAANAVMIAHISVKLSRVYALPTTAAEIVVPTLAPRNRNTFIPATEVPAMAMGYQARTCAKDRLMTPPVNPNRMQTTDQNTVESTSPASARMTTQTARNDPVPAMSALLVDPITPRLTRAPIPKELTIFPMPIIVMSQALNSTKSYTLLK